MKIRNRFNTLFPSTKLNDINLDWLISTMKQLWKEFQEWPRTPLIRNGNWWIWNDEQEDYVDSGTAATGPQGPQGITGLTGPQGPQGVPGEDGVSIKLYATPSNMPDAISTPDGSLAVVMTDPIFGNYALYEDDGFSWENKGKLEGPQGPQGPQGPRGPQGPQGVPGEVTQAEFDALESAVGYYEIDKHVVIDDLTFVVGGISQAGVADGANTARARSSNALSFYGANTVKISLLDNLYEYSLRFYDIKTNAFLRSDSTWSAGERTLTWNNNESIRVVVRLATNAVIPNTTLLQNIVRFDYTLSEIFREPTPAGFETRGNTEILAAKTLSFTDGTQPVNEYYIVASPLTRIVYKTYDFNSYTPLCVLPFAIIDYYSYGVTNDDNLIAVFTIQSLNDARFVDRSNGTDACRKPAYVFLDSENYQTAHKVDLIARNIINPTGWLNNSGFYSYNGAFLFCEYTRTIAQTCNIWKVSGDITDPANWNIKLQLTLSGVNTGLKHMHCLVQDPYTNFLYMSTGDDSAGAATYYSTDLGETWTLLASGEEKYHRYLNLIFTKQYIYYATDTYRENMHYLYRTTRDTGGVMSFSNIEVLQDLNNRLIATYGTVYLPAMNKLFLPERRDSANGDTCNIIVYDIDTDTIATIDTLHSRGNTSIGFRCRYIDYVARDSIVKCGFGASFPLHNGGYPNYITMFNNTVSGFPVCQCNNLFLRFGEKHVAIDTNTH